MKNRRNEIKVTFESSQKTPEAVQERINTVFTFLFTKLINHEYENNRSSNS